MKTVSKNLSDGSILMIEKIDQITFPKGVKILVTDPCYWFDNKEGGILDGGLDIWKEICNLMFPKDWDKLSDDERIDGYGQVTYTTVDGKKIVFLYTGTAHGDGSYEVVRGGCVTKISGDEIGVDAGLYAVCLLEDAKLFAPKDFEGDVFGCGMVFETTAESTIVVDGKGNMEGALYCDTGGKKQEYYCPTCGDEVVEEGETCWSCWKEEQREQEDEEDDEE